MEPEQENLKMMSKAHNYNRWIYNNIREFLGERILEVGAGIGNMTPFFLPNRFVMCTEVSQGNLSQLRQRFGRRKNLMAASTDISKKCGVLKKYHFDTVAIINVLEHMQDDLATLRNAYDLLAEGGRLVLVLPAFQSIYGTIDEADKHYRRYDKKILGKLRNIGFLVEKVRYMNLPGLIGWIWHGKALKVPVHAENDLRLFDKLIPLISGFEDIFPFLPGLSLIVVCRKPGKRNIRQREQAIWQP